MTTIFDDTTYVIIWRNNRNTRFNINVNMQNLCVTYIWSNGLIVKTMFAVNAKRQFNSVNTLIKFIYRKTADIYLIQGDTDRFVRNLEPFCYVIYIPRSWLILKVFRCHSINSVAKLLRSVSTAKRAQDFSNCHN